jgi:hypothetical protein
VPGISRLAEKLLVSQKGLFLSMDLFSWLVEVYAAVA